MPGEDAIIPAKYKRCDRRRDIVVTPGCQLKYTLECKENFMQNQNEHVEEIKKGKELPIKKRTGLAKIEPLMVRADQAAALCGISKAKWYELQSSGRIPRRIKLGKASLWRVEDLRLWVREGCPTVDRFENIMIDNKIRPPRF